MQHNTPNWYGTPVVFLNGVASVQYFLVERQFLFVRCVTIQTKTENPNFYDVKDEDIDRNNRVSLHLSFLTPGGLWEGRTEVVKEIVYFDHGRASICHS